MQDTAECVVKRLELPRVRMYGAHLAQIVIATHPAFSRGSISKPHLENVNHHIEQIKQRETHTSKPHTDCAEC